MSNVTLQVKLKDGNLDVEQSGDVNHIAHGQSATIIWQLSGTAASGSFNTMTDSNPGFAWVQQPPDGVFGTPALQANGNQIQVSDNNTDPNGINSVGDWIYQLWATIDGTQYSTIATSSSPRSVMTDPTIQNK